MGVINNSANIQGKVNGGSIVGGGVGASSVIRGKSAYEVALAEGFVGTEQEWLDSLKGEEGVSITRAEINHDGELILYFSDESHINVGRVVGEGEVIEGISPEINVSAIDGGNRVTIKDVGGTKYVDIFNGTPGADGYSPTVTVSKSGKVTTITIIDKNGKKTATINDGADGDDGFSPLVSVTEINGGHRVSVTDKDGQKSFDVMDGKDGEDSEGGGTYFAVCSTAAGTAEKAVSVEGFELKVGASVTVKFNSTNSVVSPTLNVSNTGAYPIIYKGAAISAYPAFGVGSLEASKVYDFVFTGANYELVGGLHIDRPAGEKLGYAKSGGDITFDGGVGTVNRAAKAVSDEDGSNIKTTYAKKAEIPSVPVKSVNGKTGAVTLNADDVGARPDTWTPTYSDVGADKSGAAASAVSGHNTSDAAHNDIRLLIAGLVTRLDALANSDDTTLDQMAEVVKYIKDNRDLISQITTDKVSVSDIVNNVTTNVSNRPLSAAQGVALKALIDAITVPTKVSQLENDKKYLTEHQDISGKLDASKLPEAINTALAQAKESGLFDGENGDDYVLTATDKDEIAALAAIKVKEGGVIGVVDQNNNIILSGNLTDANYSIKYKMADGSLVDIGDLSLVVEEAMVNLLDTAYDTDLKTVYNGVGYKEGARVSNSQNGVVTDTSQKKGILTGLIPLGDNGDVFHVKGVVSVAYEINSFYGYYSCWDASGTFISSSLKETPSSCLGTDENGDFTITMSHSEFTIPNETAYIRFQFGAPTGNVIMTRNQLITV